MKNFVFREDNGELKLVGDWDNLYTSEEDPWGQSSSSGSLMDPFYVRSRSKIVDIIRHHVQPSSGYKILEIGCGLGFFTQDLKLHFPMSSVVGSDISEAALRKARLLFPDVSFVQGDIRKDRFIECIKESKDVILLNQLLWYVVNELNQVLLNTFSLLSDPSSVVVISQAFPRQQRYGKDKLDGFEGAVKFFKTVSCLRLIECSYLDDPALPHIDVHFVFRPSTI